MTTSTIAGPESTSGATIDAAQLNRRTAENWGLVRIVAWTFRGRSRLAVEDLDQEGYFALRYAAERYRPELGATFSTYAVMCIRHRLLNVIQRERRRSAYLLDSDCEWGDEDAGLYDYAGEYDPPDELLQCHEARVQRDHLMVCLTDRERRVMEMRWGLGGREPATLREIGNALGLSRERVRAIKERAKDPPACRPEGSASHQGATADLIRRTLSTHNGRGLHRGDLGRFILSVGLQRQSIAVRRASRT